VRARDPLVGVMFAEGTYHGIIRSHSTGEAERRLAVGHDREPS